MIGPKVEVPLYDEDGNYRMPRYHEGKQLLGFKICPPGTEGYVPPEATATQCTKEITMAKLPDNAQERKLLPVYSGVMRYFPRALAEVAFVSRVGNEQHNPGKPLHWDRSKSTDELDALARHLLEAGTVDVDGIRHSAKVAWRALANLEKELEAAALKQVDQGAS